MKTALITGGSRGLGKNMALALAKRGINSILTYQGNQTQAEAVVEEIQALGQKAYALQLDIRDISSFDPFVDQVRRILEGEGTQTLDFLINNAGIGLYSALAEVDANQVDEIYQIHYKGPFMLTQKLLPWISEGGGVVNISSGLTRITLPGYGVYGSIKAAVETLTRYWAKELGARKIRVNVVAPGAIETDFGGGHVRDNQAINAQIASFTALGRVGLPGDIGGVVAFLCSEEAYWINGQRIEVSGGQAL
ncbi:SDR family NAD(P)-dependent oxidoreductase [Algoriphagus litoralis]|uniref:SDR family NAD(P)-dependent oxidoreductase n=1 Tax=Algoriphagus litoralis TaxID=2202829 RepID=UPI000DBA3135|nr:SDR family oxidoreductase [Algoriphagus litoralis]